MEQVPDISNPITFYNKEVALLNPDGSFVYGYVVQDSYRNGTLDIQYGDPTTIATYNLLEIEQMYRQALRKRKQGYYQYEIAKLFRILTTMQWMIILYSNNRTYEQKMTMGQFYETDPEQAIRLAMECYVLYYFSCFANVVANMPIDERRAYERAAHEHYSCRLFIEWTTTLDGHDFAILFLKTIDNKQIDFPLQAVKIFNRTLHMQGHPGTNYHQRTFFMQLVDINLKTLCGIGERTAILMLNKPLSELNTGISKA